MTALRAAVVAACCGASALGGIRWLRVAQREHYLPGAVTRFAWRWWTGGVVGVVGLVAAWVGAFLAGRWPATGFVTAGVVAVGPLGLGLRGRTSPLAWTRRARTLAAIWLLLDAGGTVLGVLFGVGPLVAAALAFGVPVLVDLSCTVAGPFERWTARTYVSRARERLRRVAPTVTAITGSYGKTSTKGYVAHLVAGSRTVVASPASFNNRAGLARAVNENLAEGSEVFVAEMGTYGRGEIAELCSWLEPEIAVITAIGPVHLERFGTEERIVEAKAEILAGAATVVLNVDDPRLALLADEAESRGQRVRRVGVLGPGEDPADRRLDVWLRPQGESFTVGMGAGTDGAGVASMAPGPQPGNVACAVAVALELGVPVAEIGGRLADLPAPPHRLQAATSESGVIVLDDTYNANPAGAAAALEALGRVATNGRRVVVTPGMVELGPRQAEENSRFAGAVAAVADDLIVVGRTNRRALLAGAAGAGEGAGAGGGGGRKALRPVVVGHREEAVAWVREQLGAGDVVLYENDLPDHYP